MDIFSLPSLEVFLPESLVGVGMTSDPRGCVLLLGVCIITHRYLQCVLHTSSQEVCEIFYFPIKNLSVYFILMM